MSERETHNQDFRERPPLRLPQATFESLMSYLKSVKRGDLVKPLSRPAATNSRTWAQVRATLTALGLVQAGEGTLLLRRLVVGETTLLGVLESQVGKDVIEAIERGESCSVGLLVDIQRDTPRSTIYRFESLVRKALADRGRPPRRRQSSTSSRHTSKRVSSEQPMSSDSVELTLFDLEGRHLIHALEIRLGQNDLGSVREIREMLSDLHQQMNRIT
jgi:hypothetical protein